MTRVLGIDIGGSGVKAAEVETATGEIVSDEFVITTPKPATPDALADVVRQLAEHFSWTGPVGVGFPGVIQDGVICTAANLDKAWVGIDGDAVFSEAAGCDVVVINDADAAGLAEVHFGAGKSASGTIVLLTLGTGIGSAIFVGGRLVENSELGHLVIDGKIAEERASSRVKDEEGLSYEQWGTALERVLKEVEKLLWPSLLVLGGGISKDFDSFAEYLDDVRTPIVAAEALNSAGIVGAALAHTDLASVSTGP